MRVPATSANLGPGFDALGLALDLHDVVTAEVVDGLAGRSRSRARGRRGAARRDPPGAPVDGARLRRARGADARRAPALPQRRSRTAAGWARRRRRSSRAGRGARTGRPTATRCSTTTRCSPLAAEIEGHPDNVAPGGLRRLHDRLRRGRAVPRRRGRGRPAGSQVVVFVPPQPVRPRSPGGCCPRWSPTGTRPPTPAAPRCWSPPSPAAPSSCSTPPRTGCTRTTASRRCRTRLELVRELRASGRTRPSSPAPGRRCSRSATRATAALGRERRHRRLAGAPSRDRPHRTPGRLTPSEPGIPGPGSRWLRSTTCPGTDH